ncbi:bola protein, partial [Flagelloscypha sp. PMI_526]
FARSFTSTAISRYPVLPPADLDGGELNIFTKLNDNFSPSKLQVQDVSAGCGTFYAIEIVSPAFKNLSMVKQHQLVNKTLKEEIAGIHGLQV